MASFTHFDVAADSEVPIKTTPTGVASLTPTTIVDTFTASARRNATRPALKVKRNGVWQAWTYKEYYEDVLTAAKSMIHYGLEPNHSVGILGFNSPEWFIADLGAIFAGGFASGIYTTNGPAAIQYVADHSRSQILVVEDHKQLEKILQVADSMPTVKIIVLYNEDVTAADRSARIPIVSWADFMRAGRDVPDYVLHSRMKVQKPGHTCTLIYTSGTTGTPKAVMITHDNVTWTTHALVEWAKLNTRKEQEHVISYLPLSHIAAQVVDIHGPAYMGACTWFAQPDALKGSLPVTLREVRPTIFLGVPRVWEKIEEKMKAVGAQTTGIKAKIARWAKRKGTLASHAKQYGGPMPSGFGLANKLVFKKIRARLGLDRCHFLATAAAPIGRETLDYFLSLYLPIKEVYGMSENTGPHTVSIDGAHHTGAVGKPIDGVETMIYQPDKDGNGEICMRGRHVMKGYLFNSEKTAEAIDPDGWLHTGDIGRIDGEGFLYITGRIKELIITAGGENVAPVPIEDKMKECCPILSNVMVIGDKRKFLSQLVALRCEVDPETGEPTDTLTPDVLAVLKELGSPATTVTAARSDAKVLEYIEKARGEANKAAVSRAQFVQKSYILPKDFSVPGGELGPTLKLRRPFVVDLYSAAIEGLYADSGE